MEYDFLLKYIVIGDTGVGKSWLLLYFIDKRYRVDHEITIGVEFGSKTFDVNGKSVKLQVWDTAGQDSFRSIVRSYYRGAAGALLVFDVTRRESFQNLTTWLEDARQNGNPEMTITLVANKVDLDDRRVITTEEAQEFAKSNGLLYVESSAKTGQGVDDAFEDTTKDICGKIDQGLDLANEAHGVKVGKKPGEGDKKLTEKKSKCC